MSSGTSWLDQATTPTHDSEMRRSVSDSCPAAGGSDGVPSDTTEDDWSRGSADDPDDEVLTPASSPSPSSTEPPEHSGPLTELDIKVRPFFQLWPIFTNARVKCAALSVSRGGLRV